MWCGNRALYFNLLNGLHMLVSPDSQDILKTPDYSVTTLPVAVWVWSYVQRKGKC